MIGDNSVGKSNLALQFCRGKFNSTATHTVGFEFQTKRLEVSPNLDIAAQIWDTAGQERFHSLTGAYLRGAVGIFLVYDVTSRSSFDSLKDWVSKVDEYAHPNAVRSLIGNKLDVPNKREVTSLEGLNFARERAMDFVEVSAMSGENVAVAMRRLIMTVAHSLIEHDERLSVHAVNGRLSMAFSGDGTRRTTGGTAVLPAGWVEAASGQFENVWTGEQQDERPREEANQGKLVYRKPQEELEKIDISFAEIKGLRRKKGKGDKKGGRGGSETGIEGKGGGGGGRASNDDGLSFGLHSIHGPSKGKEDELNCGACTLS